MRPLLTLLLLLACSTANGQLVQLNGAPGTYWLKVVIDAEGNATVSPAIVVVVDLGKPVPTPDPDDLTDRAKAVRNAALDAEGDANRAETAQMLAEMYRNLADKVSDGKIKGQDAIAFAVKFATDSLLVRQGSQSAWVATRAVVSNYWASLVQEGASDAAYAKLLQESADGLNASAPGSPQIDIATILMIIELIMELLERFFPQAVAMTAPTGLELCEAIHAYDLGVAA